MAVAPSPTAVQGSWPWAAGLLGAAAIHGMLLAAVLGWRVAPVDIPMPIAVELVPVAPSPTPELPMPELPPLPEFASTAAPSAARDARIEAEPKAPPAPSEIATLPPRPKPRRATRSHVPVPAAPSPPSDAEAPAPAEATKQAPTHAPAPSTAAAPPVENAAYLSALLRHLERHREYPRGARLRRIEGRAVARIVLARDGALMEVRIEHSAGHELLDAAALDTVRRAAPLPRVPAELPGERIVLRVPFVYRLNAAPE